MTSTDQFRGYAGRMLLALSLAWAVLQTGRFLLSPLLAAIIDDLAITKATAGLALTAFQLTYAVTQYPSGRWSDVLSRATLVVPGLAVLVAAFVAIGSATTYAIFVAGAVALGVGKGFFAIPSRALLADLFVSRRGRALGIYTAGTDVGGILASALAVVTLAYATWRVSFVPIAAVLVGLAVLYAGWNRETYQVERVDLELTGTVRRLVTTRSQREVLVAYALFYVFVGAFINFLPIYLVDAKGFTPATASAAFAVVFVVGAGVKPLSGSLSDTVPRPAIGVVGLLVAVAAMAALVAVRARLAVFAAVAVMATGYKAQFPLVDAQLLDVAPDENVGGDLGAARAVFLGVGALGPTYMGVVSTVAGYPLAFAGLAACLLGATAVMGARWRRVA